jgi:hypothetical protein
MKTIFLSRRASADYRRHIVSGLFKDVIETAWVRAGVSDR